MTSLADEAASDDTLKKTLALMVGLVGTLLRSATTKKCDDLLY